MTGFAGVDIPTSGDVAVLGLGPDGNLGPGPVTEPALLATIAQQAWDELRPQLKTTLTTKLGKGDLIGDGYTLYDIDIQLSADVLQSTVQRTPEGDLAVNVVIGRSVVIATSTTPTVLGSWADPRFSVDFGISLRYLIDIPPVAAPMSVTGFEDLRITGPHADSQNLPGDVVFLVVKAVEVVTGLSLDGTLAALLSQVDLAGTANSSLGALNAAVDKLAADGYRYLDLLAGDPADLTRQLGPQARVGQVLQGLTADTQSLLLVCRKPDTSGVIEGEVSWKDSQGRPVNETERAILTWIAQPRVGVSGMALVVAALGGDAAPDVVVEGPQPQLQRAILTTTALGYAAAPVGADLQLSRVTGDGSVVAWDSKEAPPAGLHQPDGPQERGVAAEAMRTPAFVTLVGGRAAYESVTDVFRRGPQQFALTCTAPDGGGGHATGHLVGTWWDDGEGWSRRRFRIEDVETDAALTVTCALAPKWSWYPGTVKEIAPRNWSGTVTVHPPLPFASELRDGLTRLTVTTADGQHRTLSMGALEAAGALKKPDGSERSIIIVGGAPADEVMLNPQPLPPKVAQELRQSLGSDRAIIVVGGRDGDDAALNPEPLPPKWREDLLRRVGDARVGIAVRRGAGVGALDDDAAGRLAGVRHVVRWARRHAGAGGELGGVAGNLHDRVVGGLGQAHVEGVGAAGGAVEGVGAAGGAVEGVGAAGGAVEGVGPGVGAGVGAGPVGGAAVGQAVEAAAVQARVDRFGDLHATEIDPDVFLPDVEDPTGHGTVGGIDFRVFTD
jgi:hypothetical protein